jgi:AbiV family abortive infection protein
MKPLSIDQLKVDRSKALKNAGELIKDSDFLFKKGSWARTLFLSQIAGEEIGKHVLLSSLFIQVIAGDHINWKRAWARITSHREKLELATYMEEDIFLEQPFPDKLEAYFEQIKHQVKELERFKQKALYCDFTEEIPHCPSDIISKEIALNALKWVKGRYKLFSGIEKELQKFKVCDKITKESIKIYRKKYGIDKLIAKKVKIAKTSRGTRD